jgi:hypothetical protein
VALVVAVPDQMAVPVAQVAMVVVPRLLTAVQVPIMAAVLVVVRVVLEAAQVAMVLLVRLVAAAVGVVAQLQTQPKAATVLTAETERNIL